MRSLKLAMIVVVGTVFLRDARAQEQPPMVMPARAQQQQQLSGRPQGGASVNAQQSTAPGGSSSSVNVLNTTVQVQGSYTGSVPDAVSGAVHLTLQDAIQRGMRTNLGALGAGASQQQARGQRLAALSALLPSITGNLSENVYRVDFQSEGLSASTFGSASSGGGHPRREVKT